ncbi:MAG: SDR family NAD(P)-dependent oxidoreductase [Longimicrobiales bacterium]
MLALELTGKRALVTGGSRGVGRAIARSLARAGADVFITFHQRVDDAAATVRELTELGVESGMWGGDLADSGAVRTMFEAVDRAFSSRLDIFVGNAGIWPPQDVPVAAMSDEQWRRTLAVNLDAMFYTTRGAAQRLGDAGRVVLIGSTAGQRGEAGHADYAASKGALISFVKGIAIELAPRGITVNCVAPGWIDTEMASAPYVGGGRERIEAMIPLGRVASVEDVAGPVTFLCSALARHITGEVLNVNGGAVLCG